VFVFVFSAARPQGAPRCSFILLRLGELERCAASAGSCARGTPELLRQPVITVDMATKEITKRFLKKRWR